MGVRSALKTRGLRRRHEHLIEMPHKIIEGQMAMKALMQGPERPTAVICGADLLAIGALAEAREAGVDVPGDVARGACSRVLWSDIPNNQMLKPVDRGNRRYRVFQFHYAAARPYASPMKLERAAPSICSRAPKDSGPLPDGSRKVAMRAHRTHPGAQLFGTGEVSSAKTRILPILNARPDLYDAAAPETDGVSAFTPGDDDAVR